jgi:hypothetical protein
MSNKMVWALRIVGYVVLFFAGIVGAWFLTSMLQNHDIRLLVYWGLCFLWGTVLGKLIATEI